MEQKNSQKAGSIQNETIVSLKLSFCIIPLHNNLKVRHQKSVILKHAYIAFLNTKFFIH